MAKRKFSGQRLYKLLKTVILIITIPCFFYGIYGLKNWTKIEKQYLDTCKEYIKDYPNNTSCTFFYDKIDEVHRGYIRSLKVGILVPIIFFSSTWLYKYLFPENKQKNE